MISSQSNRDGLSRRFLHADPTPSALQVFLRQSEAVGTDTTGLPTEQGSEPGVWINADPIEGCVVCNIGESKDADVLPTYAVYLQISVWEIWTNGLYRSTLHRVVHKSSNYRYECMFLSSLLLN